MAIHITDIDAHSANILLHQKESHFLDFKSALIAPAKLTRTVCAFANAEGGDAYIGIEEVDGGALEWRGFESPEDANGLIQVFESLFPLGDEFRYEFFQSNGMQGLVLHIGVKKVTRIISASNGVIYVRRNAQNLPVDSEEKRRRLELDKGIHSFEDETVDVDSEFVLSSAILNRFLKETVPNRSPADFIGMELLLRRNLPRVAAVLLFSDLPQSALPDRASVKLARYRTSGTASREALVGPAETIEGPLYDLIYEAVRRTKQQVEAHKVQGPSGLEPAKYPHETLHEIITNALIHRDYSIPDHVHIRVFDNRVEVENPGRLAGLVTVDNILDTRAIRNGRIVRLINKFPDPPNKDMGEGLNTAVEAMRHVRLKDPTFSQLETSFLVTIPHESLATAEELILNYLQFNETITNREARTIYPVQTQHLMRTILKKMQSQGLIVQVANSNRGGVKYTLKR